MSGFINSKMFNIRKSIRNTFKHAISLLKKLEFSQTSIETTTALQSSGKFMTLEQVIEGEGHTLVTSTYGLFMTNINIPFSFLKLTITQS